MYIYIYNSILEIVFIKIQPDITHHFGICRYIKNTKHETFMIWWVCLPLFINVGNSIEYVLHYLLSKFDNLSNYGDVCYQCYQLTMHYI